MKRIIKSLRKLAAILKTADISAQEIYDFYAIIGSLTEDYFKDFISDFADKIYAEFHRVLVNHPVQAFTGGNQGTPSLKKWKQWGGSESLYDKLLDAFEIELYDLENLPPVVNRKEVEAGNFIGKTKRFSDTKLSDLNLSDSEITEMYEVLGKRKDTWFTGGGTWKNAWERFQKYADALFSSSLDKQIPAVDSVLGITHHSGPLLDHLAKDKSAVRSALNAKFNAKTPADFWDKVSPKLREQINKIRRSELSLPIITFEKERDPKIFTFSPHEEKRILDARPQAFAILPQLREEARELGFSEEWIQSKVEEGKRLLEEAK